MRDFVGSLVVANKRNYIARLQSTVEHLHKCGAIHCASVPVHEVFRGQTVWEGEVEVFDLIGHPQAMRAYGWSHADGKDDLDEKFVTVLEIPPIESAQTAVKVAIAADIQKRRK